MAEPPAVFAVPMGDGELPYASFFSALRGQHYGGWVSYEICSPIRGGGSLDNLTSCARRFVEYMGRHGTGTPPT